MKINKNSAYVLLHVLAGRTTTKEIGEHMEGIDIRSIQRAFARLTELRVLIKYGPANNPSYSFDYAQLLKLEIADKLLDDEARPESKFNHQFIDWLSNLPQVELDALFSDYAPASVQKTPVSEISAKELEHLTVELSWKSSALEGNTYTLLDTRLLLIEGIKAKNKTEFETQMVLNHKNAIAFIMEHKGLFMHDIAFSALEELHRIIGYNLAIDAGVRKKLVRISASNYQPLANPHKLREAADMILMTVNTASDPFVKALLALALIPYLQIFEDGNKRTGRMLANAILLQSVGKGFSLRKTDARALALAYLAFYEFNSARALGKILHDELT